MEPTTAIPGDAVTRIRFPSERQLFDELLEDTKIQEIVTKIRKEVDEEENRRRLLASSLRITRQIIPSLTDVVSEAQRITQLGSEDVETYIHNEPRQNAACMHFEGGGIFLLISSGLYSQISPEELLFVIGHEFGHVVYQHSRLPARAILAQRGGCDPQRALRLMAWARRAEISADRVGLLCCRDLGVATKALIRLSCGLGDEQVDFDLAAFTSQMSDIEEISRNVRNVEDFYATHPFNPIRVAALTEFWQSQTLTRLLGRSPAGHSDEQLDQRISELLNFMEPEPEEVRDRRRDECRLWAAYWVAASDGRIERVEVAAAGTPTDQQITRDAEAALRGASHPLDLIRERFHQAAEACRRLPAPRRHALVQELIAVAKANLTVETAEKKALQEICVALDVNPSFPERILWLYE
jgi:tellurite resistance protein